MISPLEHKLIGGETVELIGKDLVMTKVNGYYQIKLFPEHDMSSSVQVLSYCDDAYRNFERFLNEHPKLKSPKARFLNFVTNQSSSDLFLDLVVRAVSKEDSNLEILGPKVVRLYDHCYFDLPTNYVTNIGNAILKTFKGRALDPRSFLKYPWLFKENTDTLKTHTLQFDYEYMGLEPRLQIIDRLENICAGKDKFDCLK